MAITNQLQAFSRQTSWEFLHVTFEMLLASQQLQTRRRWQILYPTNLTYRNFAWSVTQV